MNSSLGRQDLSDDIVQALAQIARYLDEYRVDVLLVAGDLFSERSRDEGLNRAFEQIGNLFGSFVARGGTILCVAGNHDAELKFEMLRYATQLGAGNAPGRFVLAGNPQSAFVDDAQGNRVQFALLPYPTPRVYLKTSKGEPPLYETLEEKNQLIQARFALELDAMAHSFDPNLPSILVSHVHVRGAQTHSLYQVSESDDVVFEPSQIPSNWLYAAYGHIHKPGSVGGRENVRYSGSPIALDAAERFDFKSCVLFDVLDNKRISEIQLLPLDGPKIHVFDIDLERDGAETALARFVDEIKPRDLVKYTLRFDASKTNRQTIALARAILERGPGRIYALREEPVDAETGGAPVVLEAASSKAPDVGEVVRDYLTKNLPQNADFDPILNLAERLLASGIHRTSSE